MNENVKFNVIIPTRERSDVLLPCLRTVVAQDYDNLDILVSDNFSQDNTREVVESLHDRRVKYINPGKRVSMSHNWEFALSHVSDGYVIYLGDDDGFLPGALAGIGQILAEAKVEAVGWQSAMYHWPMHPDEASRNMLSIPLGTEVKKLHSTDVLTDVLAMKRHYRELPLLYKGAVSYRAIQQVRQESGRFYWSLNPDVYSAVALGSTIHTYCYSQTPYSVDGASHHSIGSSYFSRGSDKRRANQFLQEDNLPFHPRLALTHSMPILVAECALQASDHLSAARQFSVDLQRVLAAAVDQAVYLPQEQYEAVMGAIRKTGKLNDLADFVAKIMKPRRVQDKRKPKPVPGVNLWKNVLLVDGAQFGVTNVLEASLLCHYLLILRRRDYFGLRGVARTALSLMKRELVKRL